MPSLIIITSIPETTNDIKVANYQIFGSQRSRLQLKKKMWTALQICVSSVHRSHVNLLCIVSILVYVLPGLSEHFNFFNEHKLGLTYIRSWPPCTICCHKMILVLTSDFLSCSLQSSLSQFTSSKETLTSMNHTLPMQVNF